MYGDTAKSLLERNKSQKIEEKAKSLSNSPKRSREQSKNKENKSPNQLANKEVSNSDVAEKPKIDNQLDKLLDTNEEFYKPSAGDRIIFILQYAIEENKYVLPFPLKYDKELAPIFYRNMIRKLRGQIRHYENNDDVVSNPTLN